MIRWAFWRKKNVYFDDELTEFDLLFWLVLDVKFLSLWWALTRSTRYCHICKQLKPSRHHLVKILVFLKFWDSMKIITSLTNASQKRHKLLPYFTILWENLEAQENKIVLHILPTFLRLSLRKKQKKSCETFKLKWEFQSRNLSNIPFKLTSSEVNTPANETKSFRHWTWWQLFANGISGVWIWPPAILLLPLLMPLYCFVRRHKNPIKGDTVPPLKQQNGRKVISCWEKILEY